MRHGQQDRARRIARSNDWISRARYMLRHWKIARFTLVQNAILTRAPQLVRTRSRQAVLSDSCRDEAGAGQAPQSSR